MPHKLRTTQLPLLHTLVAAFILGPSGGVAVRDIPSGHWAAGAVREVVNRGILSAPDGKFDGDRAVTRRELTIALAQFAKSLLGGKWKAASATAAPPDTGKLQRKTVTRYELAATLAKIGPSAAAGLPAARPKPVYGSEVFPHSAKVKAPPTESGYAAAQYLAREHMAFGNSVALAPGSSPVTPAEVKSAVTQVLVGLVDRLTEEPQNREEIAPPTRRK
jgi:hypothetical protein